METVQAIISKRVANAKHLSGKTMARLLKKEIEKKIPNQRPSRYAPNRNTYEHTLAL